jgi:hypothetical protein
LEDASKIEKSGAYMNLNVLDISWNGIGSTTAYSNAQTSNSSPDDSNASLPRPTAPSAGVGAIKDLSPPVPDAVSAIGGSSTEPAVENEVEPGILALAWFLRKFYDPDRPRLFFYSLFSVLCPLFSVLCHIYVFSYSRYKPLGLAPFVGGEPGKKLSKPIQMIPTT